MHQQVTELQFVMFVKIGKQLKRNRWPAQMTISPIFWTSKSAPSVCPNQQMLSLCRLIRQQPSFSTFWEFVLTVSCYNTFCDRRISCFNSQVTKPNLCAVYEQFKKPILVHSENQTKGFSSILPAPFNSPIALNMTQNHFSECVKVCVLLETSWVVTPKTSWKHRVFERSNEFISFFPNKTPGPISLSSCLEADISALVKAMWQKWEDLKTISMLMEQIQLFDFIRWGKEYLWVLDILSLLRCNGFK